MQGAKCDAEDCEEFERGGSAGSLSVNMENLPPTQKRALAITLYQEGVLEMDDVAFMNMANGESLPRIGHVHVDLCRGHLTTALVQFGVIDSPQDAEAKMDATDIEGDDKS